MGWFELIFGSLSQLQGDFDLIYIDADQFQYEAYVRAILDRKLLSPQGIMLVDDGKSDLYWLFCIVAWLTQS